jgi:hypothetical protein
MFEGPTLELKPEHIQLLKRMNVGWQVCEYGAPEIDPKRPYGNSSVEADICEILGWTMEGDESCWSSEQRKRAEKLHQETMNALQIVLACMTFEPGIYRQRDKYDCESWEKVATPANADRE